MPTFISYSQGSTNNDFHLSTNDTAAIGMGTNLTAFFTTDFNGAARPASGAWTIGAYEGGESEGAGEDEPTPPADSSR